MTKTLMDIIRANQEALYTEALKQVKAQSEHYAAVPDEQLRASFLAFLGGLTELWESGREDGLRAYAQRVSQQRVPAGFRISEIQRGFGALKVVIWLYLEREFASDLPSFFDAFRRLDEGFATFIYAFSDAYAKTQAEEISKLQAEALQASEVKFRALFEAARDGFFIIDLEGNYIDVNPAACQMVGYTREELLAMNTMDLLPPEYPRAPLAERQARWRRGGRMEVPLVSKPGGRVPVDMTFGVIQYHGQEAILGVCRDVTERKQMEEALQKNEEQLRLITDAVPVLISYVDSEERYRFNNKAYEEWFGHPRAHVSGKHLREVVGEQAYEAIRSYVEAALSGQRVTYESLVPYKDGGTRFVSATYIPHFGAQGKVEGFVALVSDTTEHKRAEDTLRWNARELAVRNRIAEIFLTLPDEQMYTEVLAILLETMQSKYGVFGYLDEKGGLVVPTMTRTIWDKCQISDKRFVFPRETWGDSSWPRAVRQKRTICLNEPSTKTPEGHISIERHISLPIIHQGEVIGLFQVANKETDYTEEDIYLLEMIGGAMAPVLDARLKRERQEAGRKQAEEQLKAYQAQLEEKVELLETQQATIRELATPVIQVWEGILVLPLVGMVDSIRVRQIMETLLARIVETQSEIVILDITGVPMVDTAVANHLIKTVQAARMLGARSIVTGLSPKVAQTVVELGVELTGVTTCANLRAGLETALGMLGAKMEA